MVLSYLYPVFVIGVLLSPVSQPSASALFEDDSILEISLRGPLDTLLKHRQKSVQYPFVLSAEGTDHQVKVRLRGNSRRQVCNFPPLRLNFASSATSNTVFEGQDKLKLVTHCRNSSASQANALEEYAAYKIFSLLSDVAYRVRLVHIAYTDTDENPLEPEFARYGFLIEPTRHLETRVGGLSASIPQLSLRRLDQQQAALVFVFQYLIGNTDWSLVTAIDEKNCCHNIDLIEIAAELHLVPYDFDLAGLVNARYAKPDRSLGISRVTQRRYRGFCAMDRELGAALELVKSRKADIMNEVMSLPASSARDKKSRRRFLEKFFARAEDETKLLRSFERRCLDAN